MDPLEVVAAGVLDALAAEGIPAALAGGLAANVWLAPSDIRPTFDVDIAILPSPQRPISDEDLAASLSKRLGMAFIATGELTFRKARIRRFFCVPNELTVDLLLVEEKYCREALGRTGLASMAGTDRPVLAPEDAILFKSLARRDKDIGPISAIAREQKLDMAYVERWARKLGTWGFVSRAIRG